jgi:hypothetical protein
MFNPTIFFSILDYNKNIIALQIKNIVNNGKEKKRAKIHSMKANAQNFNKMTSLTKNTSSET